MVTNDRRLHDGGGARFFSRKRRGRPKGFPLSWRSKETAFLTVTLGVDSCSAVVCAALSEREAVAGSTATHGTRTGDPVGWQSLPVWPPIQDKFTLLCWIKKKERAERINLHHSSALLWQRRKSESMFEIWPYHHCVTVALACHFMHAACIVVSECHGQLSLHNVM